MPEYRPTIAPKVRDIVYYTTLIVAAASALISGLAGVWVPDAAPQILATTGALTSVMGIIGGGLGVAYRPGAQASATAEAAATPTSTLGVATAAPAT